MEFSCFSGKKKIFKKPPKKRCRKETGAFRKAVALIYQRCKEKIIILLLGNRAKKRECVVGCHSDTQNETFVRLHPGCLGIKPT